MSRRLLIIDDEPAVRKFLRLGLEPKGYLVEEAESGAEGLASASQFLPEVIILDLGLPDIEGLEVLRRLREWTGVPVIVLTARDVDTEKVALLEAGADDYVTKPFSLLELAARLGVAERHFQTREEPKAFYKSERIEIDYCQHAVLLDGKPVKLTSTEYSLLRVLAQAEGKVVTQQRILNEVWGRVGDEGAHYLRVYIGHLRKKLEKEPSNPQLVLTEPNVGYRLNTGKLNRV